MKVLVSDFQLPRNPSFVPPILKAIVLSEVSGKVRGPGGEPQAVAAEANKQQT